MLTPEQFVATPLGDRVVQEIERWVVLSLSDDPKDWHEMNENFRQHVDDVHQLLARMTEAELWEIVEEEAIDVEGGVLCDCPQHRCVEFCPAEGWHSRWFKPWSLDVADAILQCEASAWWADAWDRRSQVCLVERAPTCPGEFTSRNRALSPPEVVLWTSSAVQDRPSTEEGYIASDYWRSMFENELESWRYYNIDINPTKPVYEIDSQSDWARLCEFAPVVMPKYQYSGYVEPDWARVAKEWSGVHVTVNGLISCLNVEVPTSSGLAMMAHWLYERTAWLEWSVTGFEQLPDVPGATRMPRSPVPPRLREVAGRVPLIPPATDLNDDLPSVSVYGSVS